MCACNKKKGVASQFTVVTASGEKKVVASEQEARTQVRMHGGSYSPVK